MMRFVVGSLLTMAVLLVAGCGPSGPPMVVVKGKLLKGGKPLPIQRPDIGLGWVQMKLIPEGSGKEQVVEMARAAQDGSFEFVGEGKGITVGTYKLSVLHYEQGPPNDGLQGAFADDKTPIRLTITADKGNPLDLGTIELDSPPK
ncbi:MAG: hypothetical protein U0935_15850 [Pirellulales bacterium]